jgi:hypothetical protein
MCALITKKKISDERIRIVFTANQSMILLYWEIGRAILERQQKEGWGSKVIDRMLMTLKILS